MIADSDGVAAPVTRRLDWLDVAKGIGILFVVFGHALAGLIDGGAAVPMAVRQLFYLIYVWHMFLFFMLAGALVQVRVGRDPARFRRSILTKIAWPYFLWSTIQLVTIALAGSLANHPADDLGGLLLRLPVQPMGQFWFLFSLFFLHTAAAALVPRLDGRWLLVIAVGVRSLAQWPGLAWPTLMFALPYAIGVTFALRIDVLGGLARHRALATVALTGLAALLLAVDVTGFAAIPPARLAGMDAGTLAAQAWQFGAVAAAAAMSFAVIALSHYAGPLTVPLGYLGRQSFPIFLLHVLFVAGGRIVFDRLLGIRDYAVILPAITLLGIAGPLAAQYVLKRLRLDRWLGLA